MATQQRIYLDHAATTPLLPQVADAMAPWILERYGNASSLYAEGRKARAAVDTAREVVSQVVGCEFGELIFTSSGTEAANLAIVGAALGNTDSSRSRFLFSAAEHHCTLNTRETLERLGYIVELIPVDKFAIPKLDELKDMIGPDVLLVAAMSANNELGTISDTAAIASIACEVGSLYFCDAVQSPISQLGLAASNPQYASQDTDPQSTIQNPQGTLPQSIIHNPRSAISLASFSAHKLNGPKGAGAIYVKGGTKIKPVTAGGGQERELRAGTENVAAIVGFAEALAQHQRRSAEFHEAKLAARTAFVKSLDELNVSNLRYTIPQECPTLPGHVHLRFAGVSAESMLILLDRMGVSASSGSACSSGSIEPSHVMLACGYSEQRAKEGLRFTFGISNTVEEGIRAAELVAQATKAIHR